MLGGGSSHKPGGFLPHRQAAVLGCLLPRRGSPDQWALLRGTGVTSGGGTCNGQPGKTPVSSLPRTLEELGSGRIGGVSSSGEVAEEWLTPTSLLRACLAGTGRAGSEAISALGTKRDWEGAEAA